jgi:hypothetical protein
MHVLRSGKHNDRLILLQSEGVRTYTEVTDMRKLIPVVGPILAALLAAIPVVGPILAAVVA